MPSCYCVPSDFGLSFGSEGDLTMFGINPPWVPNGMNPEVAKMAFNLYAIYTLEEEEEKLAAARIKEEENLDEADD
jgi:hypothetical protein